MVGSLTENKKKNGVVWSPSDSALCFFGAGVALPLRDSHRRICRPTLWAVNTAERSGFFRRSTMGLSHITARLQTTCQARSPHIYQLQAACRQGLAHTHLPAEHPHLIIESVLAPYCAPRGSSAHKMATEKNPDGLQQADIAG